jgi:hypothetical protein
MRTLLLAAVVATAHPRPMPPPRAPHLTTPPTTVRVARSPMPVDCWQSSAGNFRLHGTPTRRAFSAVVNATCNTACGQSSGHGTRLRSLDRWGQVTGELMQDEWTERRRLLAGTNGVGLYVAAACWASPTITAEWHAPSAAQVALRTTLDASNVSRANRSIAYFHRTSAPLGDFAAVASPTTLRIMRPTTAGTWIVAYQDNLTAPYPVFSLRSILDINGDGMPEVIYHTADSVNGPGHDVVLATSNQGATWFIQADNEDTGP